MIFSKLLEPLKETYGIENMPFMQRMLSEVSVSRPYQGLKVLHNIPLCLNTLFKIEPLILGGAELVVSNPHFCLPDISAIKILEKSNIPVELNHHKIRGTFDYVLDSAGDFKNLIIPNRGAAELTKSGELIYSDPKITYPVINVDNSGTKILETSLGTGESLVRGLNFFLGDAFHYQDFVLFGYGKVGAGVAKMLGPLSNKITVVDLWSDACLKAIEDGFLAISGDEKELVYEAVKNAYGIITATGVKNIISNNYDPRYFRGKHLVNIGIDDEYGDAFSEDEVLNEKQAINFALSDPTNLKYMDPIFYAHNRVIDLIETRRFSPGIHPFPKDVDEWILKKWQGWFGER